MSESHVNVVSFDENVSTLSNLYERNEHLLMNETTVENMITIGTVYESMMRNQRTYLTNQDNKHRLEDECTDFSLQSTLALRTPRYYGRSLLRTNFRSPAKAIEV